MALGTGTSRRAFLMSSVLALPATAVSARFFPAAEAAAMAAPDIASYKPAFFSAPEWKFLMAACDRLIPADEEGPGALEANVPVFIDQEMEGGYGHGETWYMQGPHNTSLPASFGYQLPFPPRELYQRGIKATEAYCQQTFKKGFVDLDAATRDKVLTALDKNQVNFASLGEPILTATHFFNFFWQNAKEGYLADPIYGGNKGMAAWKMIGFPGARASFAEWVTQHNVKYPLGPVSLSGERA